MKKRAVPFWVGLAVAVLLTGCSSPGALGFGVSPAGADFHTSTPSESVPTYAIEGLVYMSLEEITDGADLVVVGTFDKPLERSDDATVNVYAPSWTRLQFWSFTVDDVLKRDAEIVPDGNPRTVRVAQYDFTRTHSEDLSNVASEGARAILFLFSDRKPEPTYSVMGGQGAILVTDTGTLRAAPNASEPLAREIEGIRDRAAFIEAMSG